MDQTDTTRPADAVSTAPLQPITGPAAWRGEDIAAGDSWIYHFEADEIAELEAVGARFVADDPDLRFVQAEQYPLVAARKGLDAIAEAMERGHGFLLTRGLRSTLYSDRLSAAIFYVLGLHLGEPMRQNELGDPFDHVIATTNLTVDNPKALGSRTTDRLNFHSDTSDVVALMCLRGAVSGGESILISGAAIYNELLARRPDLAPLLFESYHWDWYKQDHDAPELTYVSPMASMVDGVFSIYAGARMIRSAQDYEGVPRLRPEQLELLDVMDEIFLTPGLPIEMDFRPGDIQWLLNWTALHSRNSYVDAPQPEKKRHLMRLWLQRPGRPLVPNFGKHVVKSRADSREGAETSDGSYFRVSNACYPRYDWGRD